MDSVRTIAASLCLLASCSNRQAAEPPVEDGGRQPTAQRSAARGEQVVPLRSELRRIPAGSYRSFLPGKDEPKRVAVKAFRIEAHPVTNAQFLRFVRANPNWRRAAAKRLFVDSNYLAHWTSDTGFDPALGDSPVIHVSWFAARAYARWIGRRLPTLQEWEYVAAASETAADGAAEQGFNQRILDWYAKQSTTTAPHVRTTFANCWGVYDMHGLVWEWVENFNTALVTGESRGDTGLERTLFCGAGSIGSANPADYASFMRFAFRSSLQAAYTVKNLGFRCATDGDDE
jgi:formylglycine-generating enzyme required for sulfatase activity